MGRPWPHDTLDKLRDAGYSYQERGRCMAPTCKETIWWFITPNKKWMPMELVSIGNIIDGEKVEADKFQPHWASCVASRKFSRKG